MYSSVTDFRQLTGLSKAMVYDLVITKGFPAIRKGNKYMIHTERALKWLKDKEGKAI